MATESSPPQIRTILTVAFSSVVILAALNYVFHSYFLMMTEEVEHDHLAKPEELIKLREGEQRNLANSPLPIAQAMQQLASRGRTNYAAFQPDITPQPGNDLGPMVGWLQTPNQAVIDAINLAAATPPPDQAAADAGAVSDAGKGDAGKAASPAPGLKPTPTGAASRDAGAR
jgi:hypothetical protein